MARVCGGGCVVTAACGAPKPGSAWAPLARDPLIDAAIRDGAEVVFNLSGGKDSGAATFATIAWLDAIGHPRERRHAIHADLGRAEWATTPATVAAIAAIAGLPLVVVRRRAGDLVSRWEQRFASGKARYEALATYNLIGPWSSAALRFCTSGAKVQVIGPELARRLRGRSIVSVLGLRRNESAARARIPVAKPDHRYAPPGNAHGTVMHTWHPLADWSTADVFAAHDALGIPLHEAYRTYGNTRLSCRYCILASAHDLAASASAPDNHAIYRHLVDLEASSTFSFQPGRWLADVAPHLLDAGALARIALAKRDADRRRALEAAMPPGLRYVRGWPPRLPTKTEAAYIAAARTPILARHGLVDRYPTADAVVSRFAELRGEKNPL